MITPEQDGKLRYLWIDDGNNQHVYFDVYYTVEERDDGDTTTPTCGGGVEITQVHPRWLALFDGEKDGVEPWLMIGVGTGCPIPTNAEAHLVTCFEKSTAYKNLEDVCRAHAESE